MRRKPARGRRVSRTPLAIWAGFATICLAGVAAGIPAVMAGVRSAPGTPVPSGWPAAKAARMRAEDQPRQAAASRPLLPPPALPPPALPSAARPQPAPLQPASKQAPRSQVQQQSAGPAAQSGAAGGATGAGSAAQEAYTAGIVPLTAGGPFRPSQFLGTNLWNGPVRGQWEVVQAGGVPARQGLDAASPSQEAGLFVYTRSPDPASAAAPRVVGIRAPLPDPRGMFTVRNVSGDVLTLTLSGSAKLYHFDVVSLQFAG